MTNPPQDTERVSRVLRDPIPVVPIEGLTRPFVRFLHVESASGVVLIACTVVSITLANSRWADPFRTFWDQSVRIGIGSHALDYPLWYWVNDGLMTIFFFVIGLEIKREVASCAIAVSSRFRSSLRSVAPSCPRRSTRYFNGVRLASVDGPFRWPLTSHSSSAVSRFLDHACLLG